MGAEFAQKYPKIAGRLLLEPDRCADPHTERLIEAFAFIAGRIFQKIDDDFPEIAASLLNIIYPHYINPIPSMSVVKVEPLKQSIPQPDIPLPRVRRSIPNRSAAPPVSSGPPTRSYFGR